MGEAQPRKGINRDDVLAAYERIGTFRGVARELGLDPMTVKYHIRKEPKAEAVRVSKPTSESFTVDSSSNATTITSVSSTVRTLEDALRVANVDTLAWEVDRHTINKWDMARGTKSDEWDAIELWQVKVWLKRRKQAAFIDPLQTLIDGIRKVAPKPVLVKRKSIADPNLLVLGLFDAHFGKLAWSAETGNDYDLHIAEHTFSNAFDDLMGRLSSHSINQISLPIGQDFFHTDNKQNATTNGTPQDVDGRRTKMFNVGVKAMMRCIDTALEVAPVQLCYSPGNHDHETSWYLTRVLEAYYHRNKYVQVDSTPTTRKYLEYGITMIGFDHGNEIKPDKLPGIMAAEQREAWARVRFTEWFTGHFHKEKEIHFTNCDTYGGTIVRTLPSLSATDAWHYLKGYVHGRRAAQAFLYSQREGFIGQFNANARSN